jgi:multidrug efflux system membrane fusion protein
MGYTIFRDIHVYRGTLIKRHFQLHAIGVLGLVFLGIFPSACSNEKTRKPVSAPLPVIVVTATQKNVPVQLRAIGNVQAYSTVVIKSKVGGELVGVHFKEGQDVKKGDFLFTIDPRPFEAHLKQAEANLARDLAQVSQVEADLAKNMALVKLTEANLERDITQAENAKVDAERYLSLIEKKVISKQQYDQFQTKAEVLEATVLADKAAKESAEAAVRSSKAALENALAAVRADQAVVENVKIQLGYCFIRSPIDGRTGSLLVQQGTIIKPDDVNLVIIHQIVPIYVTFSVPEQHLFEVKKYMSSGQLKVEALIPMNEEHPARGVITFIDHAVDSNTGTIRLKGTFDNIERKLWPGQFVNIVLTLITEPNVIVVPSQAIQTGQQGQYVFVVKSDFTVESKPVVVGRTINGEAVIQKGLQIDEKVVTDGQLRLYPGAKVEIKSPNSATDTNKKTP